MGWKLILGVLFVSFCLVQSQSVVDDGEYYVKEYEGNEETTVSYYPQEYYEYSEEQLDQLYKDAINEMEMEGEHIPDEVREARVLAAKNVHVYIAKTSPVIDQIAKDSNLQLQAYKLLVYRDKVPKERAIKILNRRLSEFCKQPDLKCRESYRFRTIDGTCNNLRHPYWGAAFSRFNRLRPAVYEDGYNSPRGGSPSDLPNPRVISQAIHQDLIKPDALLSNMAGQYGQFVDHDLTLTPDQELACCTTDKSKVDCFSIDIFSNDTFYGRLSTPQRCLDFTRSTPFCFPGQHGLREQTNSLTAFLDGSSVYGSSNEREQELREYEYGLLRTSKNNSLLLPKVKEVEKALNKDIHFMGTFLAGDDRVNEMPALAVLHTLFMREHNRIARRIYKKRPSWSDELIFQTARRLVIAEMQNIVYGQYFAVILGNETMHEYDLTDDTYSYYDPTVDATMLHEFATAAYRFGHTLINGIIEMYKGFDIIGSYELKENFFESDKITTCPNGGFSYSGNCGYSRILNGLFLQPAQVSDRHVTSALQQHVLQVRGAEFGSDLIARNIQRGRDHGIPPYNEYRKLCKLPSLTTWSNRPKEIPEETWKRLQYVYSSPLLIDLFTGGLSETPKTGAVTGHTFNCIKAIQLKRTKFGDRFFYTHTGQVNSFTPAQLKNIKARTLGDIICDNSDVDLTSLNVFLIPSKYNPMKFCNDSTRPKLNINIFIDPPPAQAQY